MNTLEVVRLLDAVISLAISAGVSVERYNALRAQSASGRLTAEQLEELAASARQKVERL
jgi:hypothetical protein